jgi:hypothetical protein
MEDWRKTQLDDHPELPKIDLFNVEFGSAKAVTGFGDEKVIIDGTLSMNVVNSVMYDAEVQLQVFSDQYIREPRFKSVSHTKWHRAEIFFRLSDLPRLIAKLQELYEKAKGE